MTVRGDVNLGQRYRAILSYTGAILLVASFLMVAPLLALTAWPEESTHSISFILPAAVLGGIGAVTWRMLRPREPTVLTVQEGGVIVVLSWIVVFLFSSWPFVVVQKLGFTQAVFECVSGWTTTGLSVIDVAGTTHVILLWRSIMQLAGGAGLAIIMLVAIAGPRGPGLSVAEGRTDQLVAHVRESGKLVVLIYAGYALAGILAYRFAGMGLFDAVNHTFAAISTGGFSTKPDSIGHWDSAVIEAVTISLMILGNLNFLTAYLLLRGKFKAVCRSGEVRLMAVLLPASAIVLFLLVSQSLYPSLGKGARVAIFETVAALTTTGFSTTSYSNWNPIGLLILIVLMLVGGGTCSTAGGIKQYRVYLLFKSVVWEMRRRFLPRTAVAANYVWQGERKEFVTDRHVREVAVFFFLYLAMYVVGAGILAAHGYGLKESLFEFASALGTVGLSAGVTTASCPTGVLWAEILGMFLGRLECFVVLVSIGKIIRDSYAMLQQRQ